MKFIVNTDLLLSKLQAIGGTIVSKPVIPILDHFLFEITEGQLKITATDLETSMSTTLDVQADENIRIAVPSKLCLDTLRSLPNQPVTFSINKDNLSIEIKSEFGRYKLVGQNGDDFPKIPDLETSNQFDLEAGVLSSCISKTLFATGNDDLRLSLTGVFVHLGKSETTFVATDANRLVQVVRSDIKPGMDSSFILPKKALNLLKTNLPHDNTTVSLALNESNAFFTFDSVSLICRLIDEKYPDYNAVIPQDNPNQLNIARQDLLNSVKRISIFANKSTNQINMKIKGSEITISAEDIDLSNEAVERLGCDYTGEDLEIGFNARLLLEMLQNLDATAIRIEMSTPNRAGIVIPSENEDKETLLMLIMPMMIASQM